MPGSDLSAPVKEEPLVVRLHRRELVAGWAPRGLLAEVGQSRCDFFIGVAGHLSTLLDEMTPCLPCWLLLPRAVAVAAHHVRQRGLIETRFEPGLFHYESHGGEVDRCGPSTGVVFALVVLEVPERILLLLSRDLSVARCLEQPEHNGHGDNAEATEAAKQFHSPRLTSAAREEDGWRGAPDD